MLRNFVHLKSLLNSTVLQTTTKAVQQFRLYASRKRFYRKTGILQNDSKYEITLDQRKLKTPKGNLFLVNNEALALAVASEWDAQKDNIAQSSMHLSTLCNTAIDNPNNLSKFDMANYIGNYLDSDTLLFQSGEDDELYDLQVKEWDPIIQWFCDRFQVDLKKNRGIQMESISDNVKGVLIRHILSYNIESIHGFVYAVDTLKSVILTLAAVEQILTTEKAVELSRLEEEYQATRWGKVEWAHDLNQQDLQARVSATMLFIYLNSSLYSSKHKTKNVND